jgi:hypothetical protein
VRDGAAAGEAAAAARAEEEREPLLASGLAVRWPAAARLGRGRASASWQAPPRKRRSAKTKPALASEAADPKQEIAYVAKRHRVSLAIIRGIIRRSAAPERGAIERAIARGKARR